MSLKNLDQFSRDDLKAIINEMNKQKPDIAAKIVANAAKKRKKICGIYLYPKAIRGGYYEMSEEDYKDLKKYFKVKKRTLDVTKQCHLDCVACDAKNEYHPDTINEKDVAFVKDIREIDLIRTPDDLKAIAHRLLEHINSFRCGDYNDEKDASNDEEDEGNAAGDEEEEFEPPTT